ncbi:hypothetical protein [Leptospira kanakyensis]|uniref:hypothetical protein n=1 Tax=Leptospira kanakyensis TaxID=2484968 RepID=UPI00223E0362|nr:hypothetical protein [Leptospira kanakyensis]MCW7469592.1 hypothetical protein [Leptospira kanakyensis]
MDFNDLVAILGADNVSQTETPEEEKKALSEALVRINEEMQDFAQTNRAEKADALLHASKAFLTS